MKTYLPQKTNSYLISNSNFNIPIKTARLLFVCDGEPKNSNPLITTLKATLINNTIHTKNIGATDPSTIYTILPVNKPDNTESIERPDYFPSYSALTPEQRWIYLNWLQNITNPINIGYVFIYYYGLERHLFLGDFENAFKEIMVLRQYHKNTSFLLYSESALVYSCVIMKYFEKLKEIYAQIPLEKLKNVHLLIKHQLQQDLTYADIINISHITKSMKKYYLKRDFRIYEETLNNILIRKFGKPCLPISVLYTIEELPKTTDTIYANYTFPKDVRAPEMPNFFIYERFINELTLLFEETHNEVKLIKRKNTCNIKKGNINVRTF